MTRRARFVGQAAVVAAAVATAWALPSSALAVAPNQLASPASFPLSGTTDTTFTLSVRYDSAGGNPAGAVTVTVAGMVVPLSLLDGSTTSGAWAAEMVLPAGSWSTTFRASPGRGPKPVITGPTLTVAAPDAATPDPSVPVDRASPSPATSVQEPASPSGTGGSPSPAGSAPPASGTGATGGGGATAASQAPVGASAAPTGRPVPATPGETTATASEAGVPVPGPGSTRDPVLPVMAVGLGAIAVVAIAGGIWLFLGGRRDSREPALAASMSAPADPEVADRAMAERAIRRARFNQTEDPILAGMGLGRRSEGRPTGPNTAGAGQRPAGGDTHGTPRRG